MRTLVSLPKHLRVIFGSGSFSKLEGGSEDMFPLGPRRCINNQILQRAGLPTTFSFISNTLTGFPLKGKAPRVPSQNSVACVCTSYDGVPKRTKHHRHLRPPRYLVNFRSSITIKDTTADFTTPRRCRLCREFRLVMSYKPKVPRNLPQRLVL